MSSGRRASTVTRLRVVTLLACVLALDSANTATIGAIAVPLRTALGIDDTQIGLLLAASTGIGALTTLPAGLLIDKVSSRTRLLRWAIALWSVAMAISAAANSFEFLLLSRLALGAVVAISTPAVASLLGDFVPAGERARAYGFVLTGELVGVAIGYLASGSLAELVSWRASFVFLAIASLVLAAVLTVGLPEPRRGGHDLPDSGPGDLATLVAAAGIRPDPAQILTVDPANQSLRWAVRHILRVRSNRTLIVASALGYCYLAGAQTFGVEYLRDRFSLNQTAGTSLLVGVGLGSVLGVLAAGFAADRLIRGGTLTGRVLTSGVAFLFAAALFLPAMLSAQFAVAVPLFALGAAGLGAINPPLDAARLDTMPPRLRGRADGVRTVLRLALSAVGPVIFGYLATRLRGTTSAATALSDTFIIMLVPVVAAGLITLIWARRSYLRDIATASAGIRT
ncbi:MAG TPA: MFS transporter [Pseudonocardiaceae bacterium]|jgi:predicted MFS family arabinose efflux permease